MILFERRFDEKIALVKWFFLNLNLIWKKQELHKSSLRTTQWFLKHVLQCLVLKDDFFLNEDIVTSIAIEDYRFKRIRVYNIIFVP
jgi:hypothetical protein